MLFAIKTGHDSSFNHRYEIISEDLSWDEAQQKCKDKGGYLLVINSEEESRRIQKMIIDKDMTEKAFYIGCKGINWILKDGTKWQYTSGNIYVDTLNYFYEDITGASPDNPEMNYGMLYVRKEKKYDNALADIFLGPNDLPNYNKQMVGKVGFICEYDK